MRNARIAALAVPAALALAIASGTSSGDQAASEIVPAGPSDRAGESGFRMEGDAHVSVVFGDITSYREHVDRFYALDQKMTEQRHAFSRAVTSTLAELGAAPRRTCPVEEAAPYYAAARRTHDRFEELGGQYQARYRAIRELHATGDTAGLTPDYRWKVNRTRAMYRKALRDLREMRVMVGVQLWRELRHQRCKPAALLEAGTGVALPPSSKPLNAMPEPRRYHQRLAPEPVRASTVTFYVDNSRCDDPLEVYVDGAALGTVKGRGRGAFRAHAGRHSMCLLPPSQKGACGQQGTVRHAFVYDGWSISLHCLE